VVNESSKFSGVEDGIDWLPKPWRFEGDRLSALADTRSCQLWIGAQYALHQYFSYRKSRCGHEGFHAARLLT
jgi:hypothetical protein